MRFWLACAFALVACDGDGSYGGPNGPATRFCQDQQARVADAGLASLAGFCATCCTQEVKYRGVVENGRCICR